MRTTTAVGQRNASASAIVPRRSSVQDAVESIDSRANDSQAAHFGHRLDHFSATPKGGALRVGPANDHFEQEADKGAERILSEMQAPGSGFGAAGSAGGGSFNVTPVASSGSTGSVQRSGASSAAGGPVSPALATQIHDSRSRGGEPLPSTLRRPAERVLRSDLSRVRLHQDQRSQELAQAVGASAFATGQDIFLDQRIPLNRSTQEMRLIAHELTHTVQQRGDSAGLIQRDKLDDATYQTEAKSSETNDTVILTSQAYEDREVNQKVSAGKTEFTVKQILTMGEGESQRIIGTVFTRENGPPVVVFKGMDVSKPEDWKEVGNFVKDNKTPGQHFYNAAKDQIKDIPNINSAVFAGHSMGATPARIFANEYRSKSVVLNPAGMSKEDAERVNEAGMHLAFLNEHDPVPGFGEQPGKSFPSQTKSSEESTLFVNEFNEIQDRVRNNAGLNDPADAIGQMTMQAPGLLSFFLNAHSAKQFADGYVPAESASVASAGAGNSEGSTPANVDSKGGANGNAGGSPNSSNTSESGLIDRVWSTIRNFFTNRNDVSNDVGQLSGKVAIDPGCDFSDMTTPIANLLDCNRRTSDEKRTSDAGFDVKSSPRKPDADTKYGGSTSPGSVQVADTSAHNQANNNVAGPSDQQVTEFDKEEFLDKYGDPSWK